MSFIPVKSDNGAVLPWEYMPAAAAADQVGQRRAVSGGTVTAQTDASATTPPYLCMADVTVATAGDPIPVTRVSRDWIYESELNAAMGTAAPGVKASVAADGVSVASTAGTFELVSVEGTAAGDKVRGRWVDPAATGGGGG